MNDINIALIEARGNDLRRTADNERLSRSINREARPSLRNALGQRLIQAGERLVSER
ncbi:MAG: hypothetical protein AAFR81_04440 [Chloroflexota bacterium]